jgi:hypothetical protein
MELTIPNIIGILIAAPISLFGLWGLLKNALEKDKMKKVSII